MEKFLETLHHKIGEVGGEVVLSLVTRRIVGGRATLRRWSRQLNDAAKMIETQTNENKPNEQGDTTPK